MSSNYLRRVEALEQAGKPQCDSGCVKCGLARIGREDANAGPCDGEPMSLTDVLLSMEAA
jgi:hypothetical protein